MNFSLQKETDCRGKNISTIEGFSVIYKSLKEAPRGKVSHVVEQKVPIDDESYRTLEVKISRPKRMKGYIVLLQDMTSLESLNVYVETL